MSTATIDRTTKPRPKKDPRFRYRRRLVPDRTLDDGTRVFRVYSFSRSDGTVWHPSITPAGAIACDCPAYKPWKGLCKHGLKLAQQLDLIADEIVADEPEGEYHAE